jgi:hypothetical protein
VADKTGISWAATGMLEEIAIDFYLEGWTFELFRCPSGGWYCTLRDVLPAQTIDQLRDAIRTEGKTAAEAIEKARKLAGVSSPNPAPPEAR